MGLLGVLCGLLPGSSFTTTRPPKNQRTSCPRIWKAKNCRHSPPKKRKRRSPPNRRLPKQSLQTIRCRLLHLRILRKTTQKHSRPPKSAQRKTPLMPRPSGRKHRVLPMNPRQRRTQQVRRHRQTLGAETLGIFCESLERVAETLLRFQEREHFVCLASVDVIEGAGLMHACLALSDAAVID